jgi:hypothetical protein
MKTAVSNVLEEDYQGPSSAEAVQQFVNDFTIDGDSR